MTLANLVSYVKRRLGYPVIQVLEITDEQIIDCIDEAFQEFTDNHFSGTHISYIPHDIIKGQQLYVLDSTIRSVVELLIAKTVSIGDPSDPMLMQPFYVGGGTTYCSADMIEIEVFRQQIAMANMQFDNSILYDFNTETKKLYLLAPPREDKSAFLKVFVSEDADIETIYNNDWIKKYSTALARIQWGYNLSKYSEVALTGGGQFNYELFINEGKEERERLLEELDSEREPLDIIFG